MRQILLLVSMAALCCAASLPSVCLAQSSGGVYEITRHTVDSGGQTSTGGAFELTGTIAQPDASMTRLSGGEFSLSGGFWSVRQLAPVPGPLFSDGFESP